MTGKDLIRLAAKNGWYIDRISGSHHILKHPTDPHTHSVPCHAGVDLGIGLLNALKKALGLK